MDNFGLDFSQYQRDRQEWPSPYEEDEKMKEEIHEALILKENKRWKI